MATQKSTYLIEIKELLANYGIDKIAALLGKTQRAVSYWVADRGAKIPNTKSQNTIHELFMKHRAGEPLGTQQNPYSEKDKKIADLLERENKRLQKDIDINLTDLHESILVTRAMIATNQNFLIELLAKQKKVSIEVVVEDANKQFDEFYKGMQAGGNFADVGKRNTFS